MSGIPVPLTWVLLALAVAGSDSIPRDVYLPVDVQDRRSFHSLTLTAIGGFGMVRKPRPGVPSHLHTGIDIRRPRPDYGNEPVFPIAKGVVISRRTDGPFAQIIIEHTLEGVQFWTVYEHIAGITAELSAAVDPMTPIGRFMNRGELQRYGWQFDHVHFEVLRTKPFPLKPDVRNPERRCASYTLQCHTAAELERYFYDPTVFLSSNPKSLPRRR